MIIRHRDENYMNHHSLQALFLFRLSFQELSFQARSTFRPYRNRREELKDIKMKQRTLIFLMRCAPWLIASFAIANVQFVEAFQSPYYPTKILSQRCSRCGFSESRSKRKETRIFDKQDEEQVEVGTKEYYSGFLSSPIQDETVAERGSGLEQALKLGGGVVLVLLVLFAGFMASNGLI